MTAKFFLDTNVVVYLLSDDIEKSTTAEQLLMAQPIISTQVANEFANACLKKMKLSKEETQELVKSLLDSCQTLSVSVETIHKAMQLSNHYALSHWDSLIVAAAVLSDASVLYSEDMQHGLVIETITIINPFRQLA